MNNYFRELRNLGKKIDDDIQTLEKTWESPHLIIGGCSENFINPQPYVEQIFSTLQQIKDQLAQNKESREAYISSTNKYLTDAQKFHHNLKDQCQEVETLLSEYGYNPLINSECPLDEESEIQVSDVELSGIESIPDSSILSPGRMEGLVIKSPIPVYPDDNDDSLTMPIIQQKSIATPVIKSLASVMKSEATKHFNLETTTENPQKECYSPYYGRRLN